MTEQNLPKDLNSFNSLIDTWHEIRLIDHFSIATGNTPPSSHKHSYGGEFLFAGPSDLGKQKYIYDTEKKINRSALKYIRKFPKGSTLFTCIGSTIGKTGLAVLEMTSNQQINAVFPNHQDDCEFIYYALTYRAPIIKLNAGHQAVPIINKNEFGQTLIKVPKSASEQQKIATALSDTDALISELEKLIEKKQVIKTATMQQLLTGKTRLPEFALREDGTPKDYKGSALGQIPEDWEVVSLGDIGQGIIGLTYSPNDIAEFGTLVLRSSNVQNSKLSFDNNVFVKMNLPDRVIVKEGDILICVRNGSRQLIGKCALIDRKTEGSAFGAFMSVYRTKSYGFIFYQFQSNIIQNQINETMGATINQITNKDLNSFKIMQPLEDREKTLIYQTIKDLEADIDIDIKRLDKLKFIKQGMMQELLTGKTRLV
ncbi:restriction endonuclease subunit S [Acinetobacter bereziniae]|uniref:restriction endonuclease subunit S n=1 Tax=Acinetobacter bereziniae TaxID=106648 RepID=UPI002812987C|nr:restriction endonuclease subunit S [Acinetobacter bereziniae]MDQ9817783.1 restriction endonuclease subunit S [Acinetobacter bereziniae]